MARQQPAGVGAALNYLEYAGWYACLAVDLFQLDSSQRREAWRLEDHRVTEGKRRRGLPAGDLQRIVPRTDARNDAERFTARVSKGLRSEVDVFAGGALGERGEVFQALSAGDHVDDARLLDRLSRVAGLELGERIIALAK